jgi:hypothetical protein
MSLKSALFAFALVGFGGVAVAGEAFTAKLAEPLSAKRTVIVNDIAWKCEGEACTAQKTPKPSVRDCRKLAKEVGVALTAYGNAQRQLDEVEMAACNAETATAARAVRTAQR